MYKSNLKDEIKVVSVYIYNEPSVEKSLKFSFLSMFLSL